MSETEAAPQEAREFDPRDSDTSANIDISALRGTAESIFRQALEQTRMAIAISDPHADDNPMVYVNEAFVRLTGYKREEAVGRNCRFLQGPETSRESVDTIRRAIAERKVRVVEMLNYRKDGSTFWNALHVGPIFDDEGRLTHFYGSQWDVTDTVDKRNTIALQAAVSDELQHRTKNLFGVIISIVRLSARGETDPRALAEKIEARVEALSRAHAISIADERDSRARSLHDLVSAVLEPYETERPGRVEIGGAIVRVPRAAVTPVGLMLHELATNALKYGAFSARDGTVSVRWHREGDRLHLRWTEKGGPSVAAPERAHGGTGSRIVEGVLRTLGATIAYDWPPTGMTASLDLDLREDVG